MKKIISLSIFTLFGFYYALAQYPSVNNERPRVWIESDRFVQLQNKINIPGEAQDTYNDVLYAYENWWITDPELYMVGSDSSLWTWDWSSQYAATQSLLTVFFFKMTDDPLALKRCRFIAQQIINHIDTINFAQMEWYEKEKLLRQLSENDMLLDQCYDFFPIELRDNLTQSLYRMNREFMNTFILSDYGLSYVSSHNTWNNIFCNQNALTLYHAEGLSPAQQDTVNIWYETIYDKHINGFIPCWSYYRDDDGGWNWGAAYATWSLVDQFQLFENMRIGTDKNFYDDLDWIENSINQYVYFAQPDHKCIHLGDGQTSFAADRVMYLHAKYYNDPRSQWLAQFYSQDDFLTWTNIKFQKLLYKDFDMPVVEKPALPLDWWTDKVGLSVSRSSWDSTAVMTTFFNSPSKKAAHEHRDNNNFTIFKNAPLIIDAGYYDSYGSEHYKNYYQRTIAHNSICVFDSTETFTYFGEEVSNDGGQIESFALMNYDDIFRPENQRGEWQKYAAGEDYQLSIADAQLSYDESKLDYFRRRMLYIKPNRVIILDHVHLLDIESQQRDIKWISHFVNKPEIDGSIIDVQVANHIETFDGSNYHARNGNGTVAIKTLLPINSTTTLIGGQGYEYWVNGINYPPLIEADSTYYTPGKWRIEVKPTELTDTVIYLHTIAIGDSLHIAESGGLVIQNSQSMAVDWKDTLYYFSKDGQMDKDFHIAKNVTGDRMLGIFASDLIIGNYNILIDGFIVSNLATDEHGIIQTVVELGASSHTIEIRNHILLTKEEITNQGISIYPNPTKQEINIKPPLEMIPFQIRIFDMNGHCIIDKSNQHKIDISGLASGPYQLIIFQGSDQYSRSFIRE